MGDAIDDREADAAMGNHDVEPGNDPSTTTPAEVLEEAMDPDSDAEDDAAEIIGPAKQLRLSQKALFKTLCLANAGESSLNLAAAALGFLAQTNFLLKYVPTTDFPVPS